MYKRPIVVLIVILLIISLGLNFKQYMTINNNRQGKYLIDKEIKAQIGTLNDYLQNVNFKNFNEEDLRICLWNSSTIFTLIRNSSYSDPRYYYVDECFNELNNMFLSMPVERIKNNGEKIRKLLKATINSNNNEFDMEACKKLPEFIISMH